MDTCCNGFVDKDRKVKTDFTTNASSFRSKTNTFFYNIKNVQLWNLVRQSICLNENLTHLLSIGNPSTNA